MSRSSCLVSTSPGRRKVPEPRGSICREPCGSVPGGNRRHHVVDPGQHRQHDGHPHDHPGHGAPARQRQDENPIATACTRVLSLPPRLAGMTPRRSTANRNTVTADSRTRISDRHPPRQVAEDRQPDQGLPRPAPCRRSGRPACRTRSPSPRRRANSPSTRSVRTGRRRCRTRRCATFSCPPPAKSATTNTGTSNMRNPVSRLAMFSGWMGAAG